MALAFDRSHASRPATLPRLVVASAVVALAAVGLNRVGDLVPDLSNPFASRTVDRSEPAVLHALEDLAEYRAATANYSVVLDVEKDAQWLPAFVKGERTVFLAAGAVDATVDLSDLGPTAVKVSDDGEAVTVTLPAAVLSEADVDPARSRVVSRERGIVDRLGSVLADSPTSERGLYLRAEDKLEAAARADGELLERAEVNTRQMLTELLGSLGFERVTVRFEPSPL